MSKLDLDVKLLIVTLFGRNLQMGWGNLKDFFEGHIGLSEKVFREESDKIVLELRDVGIDQFLGFLGAHLNLHVLKLYFY